MPPSELRIALYQPDIPGNAGTILRLAACLGLVVDIVGPAGFDLGDRALRRAGMDYLEMAALASHADFAAFGATVLPGRRLVLPDHERRHRLYGFRVRPHRRPASRPRIGRRPGDRPPTRRARGC